MINRKKIFPKIIFILKLLITLSLCIVILKNVEWENFLKALHNSNLVLILVVFCCMIANILLSSLKWKILLSIHGIQFEFSKLSKYYFSAFFFNNFLPTNIGGDGYRIFKTIKNPHSKAGAVTAILMERITGILALLFIGFVAGLYSFLQDGDKISRLSTIIGLAGIFAIVFFSIIIVWRGNLSWILNRKFLPQKIKKVIEHIGDYQQHAFKTFQVAFISIIFHVFFVFFRFLLIIAVGAEISIFHLALAVVISTLVALIPITINGIGLLDGSFIYLLVNYGVSNEQAVIVMLLIRALQIPLSLIGGMFYFLDRQSYQIKNIQAEKI